MSQRARKRMVIIGGIVIVITFLGLMTFKHFQEKGTYCSAFNGHIEDKYHSRNAYVLFVTTPQGEEYTLYLAEADWAQVSVGDSVSKAAASTTVYAHHSGTVLPVTMYFGEYDCGGN